MLVNVIYLKALPVSEMAGIVTIADSASSVLFGSVATTLLIIAILISIAGALNGSVLVEPVYILPWLKMACSSIK